MLIRPLFPDLDLEDMLPMIDEVIFETRDNYPEMGPKLYRKKSSKRSIEQTTEVSGIGQFGIVPEGDTVGYDTPLPGFDKTYRHIQYGLGFKVSKQVIMFGKFDQVRQLSRDLGKSSRDTRETHAASPFNGGFADTGPDGVALFATTHPRVKWGGLLANRPATGSDLDVDSLAQALTDFRAFRSHSGKRLRIPPKKVLVHPANEFNLAEILGGTMRSDTTNNTVNAFRKRMGYPALTEGMVWDYLTDDDAWFVLGDPADTELRWYDAEKFNTTHEVEHDSRSSKTAGWMHYSFGYSGPEGVYGNPGI